jgi:hypothetical protein
MEATDPVLIESDFPNPRAVRRFWTAWLVVLLVMLAALVVVILIAAVEADPAYIPPAG